MMPMAAGVVRRGIVEALGTALLLLAIVGAGTLADRIAPSNAALAAVTLAIGAGGALLALGLAFGALTGGHFNPVISFAAALMHVMSWRDAALYMAAQVIGACAGYAAAFMLLRDALVVITTEMRGGLELSRGELLATFGLVAIFCGCARAHPRVWSCALAAYVAALFCAGASPALANPALALVRAGLHVPSQIPWAWLGLCLGVQAFAAGLCACTSRWLFEYQPAARPGNAEPAA